MSGDVMDHDVDRAFLKPFRIGVLGVACLFVALGGLLAAFGTGEDRPEGVAERWLVDVGDTTRKGVEDEARDDAEEVGPVSLAAHLLPKGDTDGRAAFLDLEVGKAVHDDAGTRVPFRLHQRIDGDAGPPIDGTIVLQRDRSSDGGDDGDGDGDGGWRITAVEGPTEGLEVPSEGGRPAAEAGAGLFVGAFAVSIVVALGAALAVRAAGRAADA
jgi:hypothetical protein